MEKRVDQLTTVLQLDKNMRIALPKYVCEVMDLKPKEILRITLDRNLGSKKEHSEGDGQLPPP